jgi:hypothetical protein
MPDDRTMILSDAAYRQIRPYAIQADVPTERAASDAITEWLQNTGEFVPEALQKKRTPSAVKPKLTLVWNTGLRMDTESNFM